MQLCRWAPEDFVSLEQVNENFTRLDAAGGRLFTGDTLFAFGIGRCDLWGGDTTAMRQSLRRLGSLPRTLRIYPGHGESAVLGAALDRALYDL